MRTRTFLTIGALVVLLVAGVASYYASSRPDGLEHVAGQTGFLDSAEDSPAAEGPLAGYETDGVESDRVSGGLAGVGGVLLVLLITGGLFRLLRRRAPADDGAPAEDEPAGQIERRA